MPDESPSLSPYPGVLGPRLEMAVLQIAAGLTDEQEEEFYGRLISTVFRLRREIVLKDFVKLHPEHSDILEKFYQEIPHE